MEEQGQSVIPMPKIGKKTPEFTAITTHGQITSSKFKKDSWAILFSHPADFTPVFTREFVGFAENIMNSKNEK